MKFQYDLASASNKVNFGETIDFLNTISKEHIGVIKSPFPTINGLEIKLIKAYRHFYFKTKSLMPCREPFRYQDIGYGLMMPFEIHTSQGIYIVKNGASEIEVLPAENFSFCGEIWEIEKKDDLKIGYFRALLPICKYARIPADLMLGEPFQVNNSFRSAGYIKLTIEKYQLDFYDCNFDNSHYIVIDSKSYIDYSVFENLVYCIIYSYGFISSSLIRDELMILRFSNAEFTYIESCQFERIEDSIISSLEILNPREYMDYIKSESIDYFPTQNFSKLVYLCFSDVRFFRTLKIITQISNLPVEIQVSSIFVSLETIKSVVLESNVKTTPFSNSDVAKNIINEFKERIDSIPESEFNNKKSVLSKIASLNSPGNNDGFFAAFSFIGLELSQKDKDCIRQRNVFLHGSISSTGLSEVESKRKLSDLFLHANMLVSALVLKYSGYVGAIKDFSKFIDIVNHNDKTDDLLYRVI